MKLQQLKYLCEIAKRDLSFSNAADALHTSQPGISKQMRLLEEELGVELFVRSGNRIVALTEPAERIVRMAALIITQTEGIKVVAREFNQGDTGSLKVAATFTLARYALPHVLQAFVAKYPRVDLKLLHGTSDEICKLVASGAADLALTTEPASAFPDLLMLEYARLPRALFVPRNHPLTAAKSITLKKISAYPLVTLEAGSHGQKRMRELFARKGFKPTIVLAGANIDVVKAFIEAGLGIAILPRMAFEAGRDAGLRALDADHLFEAHRASIAIGRKTYLRRFVYDFIQLVAPEFDRRTIDQAMAALT